jgi:hypothetical protein
MKYSHHQADEKERQKEKNSQLLGADRSKLSKCLLMLSMLYRSLNAVVA